MKYTLVIQVTAYAMERPDFKPFYPKAITVDALDIFQLEAIIDHLFAHIDKFDQHRKIE